MMKTVILVIFLSILPLLSEGKTLDKTHKNETTEEGGNTLLSDGKPHKNEGTENVDGDTKEGCTKGEFTWAKFFIFLGGVSLLFWVYCCCMSCCELCGCGDECKRVMSSSGHGLIMGAISGGGGDGGGSC